MFAQAYNIVVDAVKELNETLTQPLPIELGENCSVYGSEQRIDSIALVSLIVNVEQRVEDVFKKSIILANEKAMSRKHSPFATVGILSNYIEELLKDNND